MLRRASIVALVSTPATSDTVMCEPTHQMIFWLRIACMLTMAVIA
jgi:hypothetical protein